MNILFLTSRVPYPPHRGDKLRTYNFLRALSREHDIALVSLSDDDAGEAHRALAPLCASQTFVRLPRWRSWAQAALGYPLSAPAQVTFYFSRGMAHAVRRTCQSFRPHAAYIHLFRMLPYRPWIPRETYTILDLTDVISKELFRSIPYRPPYKARLILREARRIRAYEREATTRVDETWVISRADRDDLVAGGGGGKIHVIPNGLPRAPYPAPRRPQRHTILFYGYAPAQHNRDALDVLSRDILPPLQRTFPDLRLRVVGAGKGDTKRRAARLPIDHLGFLDDPRDAFSTSSLLVAPVRFAAGTQNKLLEAMASGVPVVTSPMGNEGIGGEDGEHLSICTSAQEYVETMTFLLTHPREREHMGQRGLRYVHDAFSWRHVALRVAEIEQIRTKTRAAAGAPMRTDERVGKDLNLPTVQRDTVAALQDFRKSI